MMEFRKGHGPFWMIILIFAFISPCYIRVRLAGFCAAPSVGGMTLPSAEVLVREENRVIASSPRSGCPALRDRTAKRAPEFDEAETGERKPERPHERHGTEAGQR